jgi:ATP-dependent Clp protease adapter protein ClpS
MSTRIATSLVQNLSDPGTTGTPTAEPLQETMRAPVEDKGDGFRVVLYNCDCHTPDEVVLQLQKATGCDVEDAINTMLEAHTRGRAVCYRGGRDQCHQVARVLREIRLQVEVDCD